MKYSADMILTFMLYSKKNVEKEIQTIEEKEGRSQDRAGVEFNHYSLSIVQPLSNSAFHPSGVGK